MSIDTSTTFRETMDKLLLKPVGRAMANPLTLGLMISGVILFIVVCSYDRDHMFRTWLRIFGVTVLFLFINNHVLIKDMTKRGLNQDQENMLRAITRSAPGDQVITPGVAGGSPTYVTRAGDSSSADDIMELPNADELVTDE